MKKPLPFTDPGWTSRMPLRYEEMPNHFITALYDDHLLLNNS
jgi:hypothetical protein